VDSQAVSDAGRVYLEIKMDMKVENGIGVSEARFALLHLVGNRLVRVPRGGHLRTSL